MPIFKITSRTGGNQAPRIIEAPTRAAALRQLAREQFDITPATVREVVSAYHAHLKRRATQQSKDTP